MKNLYNEANGLINLSAIIRFSGDAVISENLDGIIASWNPAAEKIFGYKAEEAIGKSIMLMVDPESAEEEKEIISRIRNGESINYEARYLHKDGRFITSAITASPLKNKSNRIIGVSKISRDITKQYENHEEKAVLAAIVDSSQDAIISKSLNGIVTSWNKAAENLFGYSAEEMIGQSITKLFPPDKLAEEKIIIGKISKGIKVEHFETVRIKKNGDPIHCSLTISPIKDVSNRITGASKIVRDISYRVKMEEELKEYMRQLETINKYKDDFISVVSHELKTPVTSIKGYTQLLYQKLHDKNPEAIQMIEKMDKVIGRLVALIDDLLDAVRIQQGRLNIERESFNLKALVEEIMGEMQKTEAKCRLVKKNFDEDVMVKADRGRIRFVIGRILSNAIKYSDYQKDVIVGMRKNENEVICYVQDFGIGISQEELPKVFDRYYKFREKRKHLYPGLGLGLFISSAIIKEHQGRMWIDSKEGKGTTFFFSLPLNESKTDK